MTDHKHTVTLTELEYSKYVGGAPLGPAGWF
jgi:hypothetical protein